MFANVRSRLCCIDCKYFTDINCNLQKHLKSKKHLNKIDKSNGLDLSCKYQCTICFNKYKGQSGLWQHSQKCKSIDLSIDNVAKSSIEPTLREEINELKEMITELTNKQQPTPCIINNNITNNISVFLNDKCGNACNLSDFIERIDFKGENFEKFIMDYVTGNMEVFEKNFKLLPEFERPVYCFDGEDNHQSIAHIQHDKKWIIEPEIQWERKSIKGQDETDEEDNHLVPNSMYSLVRMFDKKKLKYFNEELSNSNLKFKCRKLESDSCNTELQQEFMKKIVELATLNI